MSNHTKTGFWQSVPGMMTAGAGILSATTGMLVALNQTGVVDLRHVFAAKPTVQSPIVEPPASTARTVVSEPRTEPAAVKSDVPVNKVEAPPISLSHVQDPAVRPAPDLTDRKEVEYRQEAMKPSSNPSTIEETPLRESERKVTVSAEPERPPVVVAPVHERPIPSGQDPESLSKPRRTQASSPAPVTSTEIVKAPATDPEPSAATKNNREEQTSPVVRRQENEPPPRPEPPVRVAEGRQQEPDPRGSPPSNHDAKKPKTLRSESNEPRAVGKSKATTSEPEKKPADSEPENESKKINRQQSRAEFKQPEKAPRGTAAPPTKDAAPAKGGALKLTGVSFTIPGGWLEEKVEPSPMGPKAVFKIPKLDAKLDDGAVRITHFPNMKGKDKDEANIDRWVGQVTKPDGKPLTRSDAKITTTEIGKVRLTIVDLQGSVKMTMRDSAKPDHRMIAAIVDHPEGPHFVVTAGPAASMEKWAPQIEAFLKSAKAE